MPASGRRVNERMPAYAVQLLADALDGGLTGRRVLILGVAYRGGVKETASSGAYALRDELRARGAEPVIADPLYDAAELEALGFSAWGGEPVHAAVLQADHEIYRALGPRDLPGVQVIVDGRNVLDPERFAQAGIAVKGIGRPLGAAVRDPRL